ncbi:MAG: amino acid permease [Alphaproteobacteria bacterium]|nr:amino acid permease [Alphaproteobacteria bacterium]MBU1526759.1 amino acid permease [Alphaproteobacteria bacterium]MBU2117289.1 amino acid permease [Alphaproteobacteria bacterium]MBU2350110.1 amino acid permease [Alphaproteobacteria bacterium]MBU2383071.1 amino acid permease [Alphaproteobacteria bacterium]
MAFWNRRRSIEQITAFEGGSRLKPTMSWPHLIALGVGAIVGTGIYTLIGVGAAKAGPAVMLAFLIAGLVCVFAALAYAELATMIPASGSAYTYSYAALGEMLAWVIGWSLILEYSLVVSAVAVGWAGYFTGFLDSMGWGLPAALTSGPFGTETPGIVNLPAVGIVGVVAGMLMLGTRESATVNAVLVVIKVLALGAFVAIAAPHFDAANLQPFMPYGFGKSIDAQGVEVGVMAAAAIIFFAFYGFDAVSTAAEETKNPKRDLTIGIVGSMVVCILIYLVVAAAAVGSMPFYQFAASPEPLAFIARTLGSETAATVIAGAAIVALPTVLLAFMYGQSRIFFVMARDGMLPRGLAKVSEKRGSPVLMTGVTAILMAVIAGLFSLGELAALANAGTLAAFVAVGAALIVLRVQQPNRPRMFSAPLWPLVGAGAILGCLYLFISLPVSTQVNFFIWNGAGLVLYLLFARRNTRLAKGEEPAA